MFAYYQKHVAAGLLAYPNQLATCSCGALAPQSTTLKDRAYIGVIRATLKGRASIGGNMSDP